MPDPDESGPSFCNAEIADGRVLEESLKVDSVFAEAVALKSAGKEVQIHATTKIENEAQVAYSDERPSILRVESKVFVEVFPSPDLSKAMVKYFNHFLAIFKISESRGLRLNMPPPVDALAHYLAQTNWMAVRRADASLGAAGVSNLRLVVPAIASKDLRAVHAQPAAGPQ